EMKQLSSFKSQVARSKSQVARSRLRVATGTLIAALALIASGARAQDRPAVGPERPFQLAPRVEKTLPNGLPVVATRQHAGPKVPVTLTILSGYPSDPADRTGLANLTADVVQEGTTTRTSREIRRQVFGMGGSLSSAVSQEFSSLTTRGLAEFAPQLIALVGDV